MSAPATLPLLEVRGLRVAYGNAEAVSGLSFTVPAGQLVALIGPNGAGKSSTLNAIAGLVRPAAGSVLLEGREIAGQPAHALVRQGVVLVAEGRAILGRMTVAENLQLGAESRPWPGGRAAAREAIQAQLDRFPALQPRLHAPAGALSGGEQQQLALARGLLSRPRILLLDEPSMGLAPQLVRQIFEAIRGIHASGTTVLLVEQNARLALRAAQTGYVLERGRIVLSGPARALERDPRIRAAYLGGAAADGRPTDPPP